MKEGIVRMKDRGMKKYPSYEEARDAYYYDELADNEKFLIKGKVYIHEDGETVRHLSDLNLCTDLHLHKLRVRILHTQSEASMCGPFEDQEAEIDESEYIGQVGIATNICIDPKLANEDERDIFLVKFSNGVEGSFMLDELEVLEILCS